MGGFIDLHCHWIAGIDDGASSPEVGVEMLRGLRAIGFEWVVATPHMRPGMFDNDRARILEAFRAMEPHLAGDDLPRVDVSSEHYFDDVVFRRIVAGEGVPYPGERAVLLEFYDMDLGRGVDRLMFELQRRKLLPVIAHPERYRPVWKDVDRLERLVDAGAAALLDTAALVGKYGRRPRRCAEEILERGLYQAACSDAHRPDDVSQVAAGIERIDKKYGPEEVDALLRTGPEGILAGRAEIGT